MSQMIYSSHDIEAAGRPEVFAMRVLLAVDGSTFSDEAVKEVARRPWPAGTEVKVISVVEPLYVTPEPWVGMEEYYREVDEASRKTAEQATEGAALKLRTGEDKSIKVTTELFFGSPKREILEEAERWGADLIVVGSHGYGFWNSLLLGSVSHTVATQARCCVEIVKRPKVAEGEKR